MSADLNTRIRALGNALNPELISATAALFAPQALRPSGAICTVLRDVSYGNDARHKLDLFRPVNVSAGCPVVVYVHGGGFVRGDKGDANAPFYNNVGAWAARCGFVGVNITYRLAPAHPWPAGIEDLAAVVAWLREHIEEHGGDPARIFLIGQSAGAAHVAGYVVRTGHAPHISGAILLSGLYDITQFEHSPTDTAYFGNDTARFAEQSTLPGLIASVTPCLFAVAEYDPPVFQHQVALLVQEWSRAKKVFPPLLYLADANHVSPVFAIGTEGDALSQAMAVFVRKHSI